MVFFKKLYWSQGFGQYISKLVLVLALAGYFTSVTWAVAANQTAPDPPVVAINPSEDIFEDFLQQKYPLALEKIKAYLLQHPDDPTYLAYQAMLLSIIFSQNADYRDLVDMYRSLDQALSLDPENFAALFVQGETFFYAPKGYGGDYRLAIDSFQKAENSYRRRGLGEGSDLVAQILYVYLLRDRGMAYYALDNFSDAARDFAEVEKYPIHAAAILEETQALRKRLAGEYDRWRVGRITVLGNLETKNDLIAGYFTAQQFSDASAKLAERELLQTGLFSFVLVYARELPTDGVEVVIKVQEKNYVNWWVYPPTYSQENLFGQGHSLLFETYYYSNLDNDFWRDNFLVQGKTRWRLNQNWTEGLDVTYRAEEFGTKLNAEVLGSAYKLFSSSIVSQTKMQMGNHWSAALALQIDFLHPADITLAPGEIFDIPQFDQSIYEGGAALQWQQVAAEVRQGVGSFGQYNYTRWSVAASGHLPFSEIDGIDLNGELDWLNGAAPHFKLPYLGGWGKLRGYSRLDLCGNQASLVQLDYKRVLYKFYRDMVVMRGVVFGEGGVLSFQNSALDSGKIYADVGAGIEVYAFPTDSCRFRLYGALNNQGLTKLIYTFAF